MIDITLDNFQAELVEASLQQPVLLDIWAEWCGPCKQLGPVLEKLERDYAGRFLLAKLDADKVPEIAGQLSQMFGVRSIPFCVMFSGGQPVDGFVGAVPEAQIRQFLDKHVPGEDELASADDAEQAQDLLASGDADAALAKLQEALAINPANDDARHDYVKLLISSGQFEEAGAALQPALVQIPVQLRFEALAQWRQALLAAAQDPRRDWSVEQFDAGIAQNKRDFDLRLAKARALVARGEWTAAMDELLEIVMRDKKWGDEVPRKLYVALLELLTPPKPKAGPDAAGKSAGGIELTGKAAMAEDPQAALVSSYRRKLSMALN
ncbi:tetratricopeptide repeat protein [Pseudorhodoferax sp.]|uniref:tetratricopeptide repeat protein n=1 Tax=Pseudorhodoferax sp. TaxID=1993553 RepID=UPI0039E4398D